MIRLVLGRPARPLHRPLAGLLAAAMITGCASAPPYRGQGPHPQIERGGAVPPVDFLGNVLSLPLKLIFWSWEFNLHYISPATEAELVDYLDAETLPAFEDTKVRLNQYRPGQDLARLIQNKHVKWPYRLLLGLPVTLIMDVLLPGRLLPWGDYYNPFTNTAHLYSDHPAIVLHEAGHAHDFASVRYKGTYALISIVPFVVICHEYRASKRAIGHFMNTHDHRNELRAYKILYPSFGGYVGGPIFWPIGQVVGILVGHVAGQSKAARVAKRYNEESATTTPAPGDAAPVEPAPAEPEPEVPADVQL